MVTQRKIYENDGKAPTTSSLVKKNGFVSEIPKIGKNGNQVTLIVRQPLKKYKWSIPDINNLVEKIRPWCACDKYKYIKQNKRSWMLTKKNNKQSK